MKRAVVVLIVLLALAGIVVFGISRFDVNGFQPKIKEQLETLTGNPVNLGKLSLAWREGLTLRLDGLQVYSRGDTSGRPAISLESASVVLRLLPLLQGKFQAASLTIKKPEFQVARDKNGGVILEGLNPQPSEIASPKPDAGKSVPVFPVSFYIRKIRIEDGRMLYLDASGPSPLSVSVRSLDANLLDFSFSKMNDLSFSAETAMAVFAAAKNLTMHGNCRWLHRESSLVLEGFKTELGLELIDLAELEKSIPAFKSVGLQEALGGKVSLESEKLVWNPGQGTSDGLVRAEIADGRFRLAQLSTPVEGVRLVLSVKGADLILEDFSARLAGGTAKVSGTSGPWSANPQTSFRLALENIALENFLPPLAASEPQLHGRTSISFEGLASGRDWPSAAKALSGQGRLALKDGVIVNLSLLKNVLAKLSMFPDLIAGLEKKVPENLRTKFEKPDTLFEPFEQPFRVRDGVLAFEGLRVVTETVELDAEATLDLAGRFSGRADCKIDRDFSSWLAENPAQMKAFAGEDGRLVFPVTFEGQLPKVTLKPDLGAIAARLATSGRADLEKRVLSDPSGASDLELFSRWVESASKVVQGNETNAVTEKSDS